MSISVTAPKKEKLYDLSHLHNMCGGDTVFMTSLLHLFVETSAKTSVEMEEALGNNDIPKVGALAHKLKPGIDTMSIVTIKQVIREVEQEGMLTAESRTTIIPFAGSDHSDLKKLSGPICS